MYTLHCTKKLLDRIKASISPTSRPPTTALGNWVEPFTGLPHRRRPVGMGRWGLAGPCRPIGAADPLDRPARPSGRATASASAPRNRAPEPDRRQHPLLAASV